MAFPRPPHVPVLTVLMLAAASVAPFALGAARASEGSRKPPIHGTYDGDPMFDVLPLDAIPAIREPRFVSGEAAERQMVEHEPIIGVVVDGEARAYSTWQLDFHEIVNDVAGGVPIAVSW